MPVDVCARLILRGHGRAPPRGRDDRQGKLGRFLKLLAPGKVEDLALAAVADEARPR
jgi:hypothetical protein